MVRMAVLVGYRSTLRDETTRQVRCPGYLSGCIVGSLPWPGCLVAGALIVTSSARRSKATRSLPSSNVFSVVDFRVAQCRSGADHSVSRTSLPSSIHTF